VKKVLLGSILGKAFEWFYERNYWKYPNLQELMISAVQEASDSVFVQEKCLKGTDLYFESNLNDDLKKYIPIGIDIIKKNKLLTSNSVAELDLSTIYSSKDGFTMRLVGRADFVHYNRPDDVWIMDGKAYKQREKYVDSDQLIWYATLHYLKYRVAPTRIGFIYWLFPDDPVSYISYNSDNMRDLLRNTQETCLKILDKEFTAKPSGECHRCAFKGKCEEGTSYIALRRKSSAGFVEDSIFSPEDVTSIGGSENG
jgi:CRISPR/Cas system-associated exonuclease Cas4 (RecB family)